MVRGGDVTETPEGDIDCVDTDRLVVFEEGEISMANGSGQQGPDTAAAAEILGVTEEALIEALGDPSQDEADFASVADELGITEAELQEALGLQMGK